MPQMAEVSLSTSGVVPPCCETDLLYVVLATRSFPIPTPTPPYHCPRPLEALQRPAPLAAPRMCQGWRKPPAMHEVRVLSRRCMRCEC